MKRINLNSKVKITEERALGWARDGVVELPSYRMQCKVCGDLEKCYADDFTAIDRFVAAHDVCEEKA